MYREKAVIKFLIYYRPMHDPALAFCIETLHPVSKAQGAQVSGESHPTLARPGSTKRGAIYDLNRRKLSAE
jgi:hypothetical protein